LLRVVLFHLEQLAEEGAVFLRGVEKALTKERVTEETDLVEGLMRYTGNLLNLFPAAAADGEKGVENTATLCTSPQEGSLGEKKGKR
jgi:hypothetical protein